MRAFLAIELDDALRSRLAALQRELRQIIESGGLRQAKISWAAPATMHLTIKFLGEIDAASVEPLQGAVTAAVSTFTPATLPLDRLGAFPDTRAPRTLWIGPSESRPAREAAARIGKVHAAIDAACAGAGVPRDPRPLSPHLTLARVRSGERAVGKALTDAGAFERSLEVGSVACGAVALMKSDLTAAGPIHTRLWSVAL